MEEAISFFLSRKRCGQQMLDQRAYCATFGIQLHSIRTAFGEKKIFTQMLSQCHLQKPPSHGPRPDAIDVVCSLDNILLSASSYCTKSGCRTRQFPRNQREDSDSQYCDTVKSTRIN